MINWNNILKWVMGMSIIGGILVIFYFILFVGAKENDITSAIVGGALIPILTLVVQFFFRKASSGEKQ